MPARSTEEVPANPTSEERVDRTIEPAAVAALLRWYEAEARDLPWRRTRNPYRILISEVMLQQTRVETVVNRYEGFLRVFPDLRSVAAASENDVLAEWSGLGYYRRARNLHRLARQVIANGSDRLPEDVDALRALPGIGEYTAAAVSSIAFDRPHLSIDGNVGRVLCRVLDIRNDPARAAVRRHMRSACEPALRAHPPGKLNQALMELGARLCTPRAPRCDACPLGDACVAAAEQTQELLPVRTQRKVRAVEEGAAVIERDGRFLLLRGQRPGTLADMWEFPTLDSRIGEQIVAAAAPPDDLTATRPASTDDPVARALQHHLHSIGIHIRNLEPIGEIRHGITNRRIRCHVYRPETVSIATDHAAPVSTPERDWFTREQMAKIPLGATAAKILRMLEAGA